MIRQTPLMRDETNMTDDTDKSSSTKQSIEDRVDLGFKYLIGTCDTDDIFLDPNRPDTTVLGRHEEFKTEDGRDAVYDIYVMGRNYHDSKLVLPYGTICLHVVTYKEGGQEITAKGQFHEFMVKFKTEKLSSTVTREKGQELDMEYMLGMRKTRLRIVK